MINPHDLVRQALLQRLESVASLTKEDICTTARGCEISAPLAWHIELPPEVALERVMAAPPVKVFDAPLIDRAWLSGGHACFLLTGEAYTALLAHIIASAPPTALPDPVCSEVDYAIARMLMLSRKGGTGCPQDVRVREALWLAMGIVDAQGSRREARRNRAAKALIGLMRGRDVAARLVLAASMGQAADCAARLLAYDAKY